MENNYPELIEKIKAHLTAGGKVLVATPLRAVQYDRRHVEFFKVGKDGSPLVRRGKHWDDIRWTSIKFSKYPGFEKIHGRKPIAGEDYSADGDLCQDDYEYLTGTGRYS